MINPQDGEGIFHLQSSPLLFINHLGPRERSADSRPRSRETESAVPAPAPGCLVDVAPVGAGPSACFSSIARAGLRGSMPTLPYRKGEPPSSLLCSVRLSSRAFSVTLFLFFSSTCTSSSHAASLGMLTAWPFSRRAV